MAITDPHPELAPLPDAMEQRLRNIFDIFHVGDDFECPEPPDFECECEWGPEYRYKNASVAILDGHRECPFCRGHIGGETTND